METYRDATKKQKDTTGLKMWTAKDAKRSGRTG